MIYGARIRQARELREMLQRDLADAVGLPPYTLNRLERTDGVVDLTVEQQQALSEALRLPSTFFQVPVAASLSEGSIRFRARRTLPKKTWLAAVRETELTHEMAHMLAGSIDLPAARVPTAPPGTTAEEAAGQARAALGLPPDDPIPHVIRALERAGVWVFEISTRVDSKLDAFSTWTGEHLERPVIAIGEGLVWDRKRHTTGHELGHLVMHRTAVDDASRGRDLEREADRFASAFLMPDGPAREELPDPFILSRLGELKARWGVSISSLVVRAHSLGVIDDDHRTSLFKQLSARRWNRQEPGWDSRATERPRSLRRMAEMVYGEPVNIKALAAQMGRYSSDVSRELARYAPPPGKAGNSSRRSPASSADSTNGNVVIVNNERWGGQRS